MCTPRLDASFSKYISTEFGKKDGCDADAVLNSHFMIRISFPFYGVSKFERTTHLDPLLSLVDRLKHGREDAVAVFKP